jgi:diacylglycerol kinase (ATP)
MKYPEGGQGLIASFKYAFKGIGYSLKTQRNAQIHTGVAILVVILGFVLKLNTTEWIIIVFAIALVLVAELFNTSIEFLIDLLSPEYHEKAGRAKDIAAGAVLICAIGAAIAGLIIFLPKLF